MKIKIALFANHKPGIDIANYLADHTESEISVLYLPGDNEKNDKRIQKASLVNHKKVFFGNIVKDPDHITWFINQKLSRLILLF